MTSKPRLVMYNEKLPSKKSNYILITWSSDFDLSHAICRFRTQTPQSPSTSCDFCVSL